jgi:hypothetical protein
MDFTQLPRKNQSEAIGGEAATGFICEKWG